MPNPRSTAQIGGHPIHVMLVPFPIVCYVLTLCSDLAYWKTAAMQWANMSAWLLMVGLAFAVLAALAGFVDFLGERRIRALPIVWIHAIGNALALALAIFDELVHSRDAYTSVVPTGLTLSVLVVLITVVTSWLGGSLVHSHGVGVQPEGEL
jgi:uncharacterized membrane protein